MSTGAASPSLQRVSLSRLIRMAGLIAMIVSGLAVVLPAVVTVLTLDEPASPILLLLVIPLLVWLAGLTPRREGRRAWMQTAAVLLLIGVAFILPPGLWLPVTTVGFAAVVGAVFALSSRSVILVIATVSVLDLAYSASRPPPFPVPDAPWAVLTSGVLLQVLSGGGLLIAWQAWLSRVTESEREYERIQRADEERQRDEARRHAASAVTRRIHETALNTLTAISMGAGQDHEDEARRACRHDLEQASMGLDLLPASSLSAIATAAADVVSEKLTVTLDMASISDTVVPASIANPLRDAIVEALRNVERHAGVRQAHVTMAVGGRIRVEVSDEGRGLPEGAPKRFGMRNALRSSMTAIGGTADVEPRPGGGTVVRLTAPLDITVPDPPPSLRTLRVVDSSRWARLGALGTNAFMLLLLPAVVPAFATPSVTGSLIVAYAAVLLFLALAWRRVPRSVVTWVAMALLLAVFLSATREQLSCTDTWAARIILAGMAGGAVLLPLLALGGWASRGLAVGVSAGASLLIVASMPSSCRVGVGVEWGVTTAYLVAFAFGLSWIEVVFERQRDQARVQWGAILAAQVEEERQRTVARTWGALTPTARDLLEGIADGSVDLTSPDVRARAAAEADTLRTSLGLSAVPGDAVGQLTRRLVRVASRCGGTVEVELLTDFARADPFPEGVCSVLESLLLEAPGVHLVIRGFVDAGYEELVTVVAPRTIADASTRVMGDTLVQFLSSGDEVHVIVRRPVVRMTHTIG